MNYETKISKEKLALLDKLNDLIVEKQELDRKVFNNKTDILTIEGRIAELTHFPDSYFAGLEWYKRLSVNWFELPVKA